MSDDSKSHQNDGIFVSEGNTLRIPGFTITINTKTGDVSFESNGNPQLHYDVTPIWLSIALDHLHAAKAAREELLSVKESGGDIGQCLEREFRCSMGRSSGS